MAEETIPADTPCASCGNPIGPHAWKTANEGRIYHEDCEVIEIPPTPDRRPGKGLGDHAERAARRVLNPGQETLDG